MSLWYLDFHGATYQCTATQKAELEAAQSYNGQYGFAWSSPVRRTQSILDIPPQLTLPGAISDIQDRGLVHLATHGASNGSVALEYYDRMYERDQAFDDYVGTYGNDIVEGFTLPAGTTDTTYTISLTPAGIQNRLRVNADNGFVYLTVSHGWQASSRWKYRTLIGWSPSPDMQGQGCPMFYDVFNSMRCYRFPPVENSVKAAIDQNPDAPFDDLDLQYGASISSVGIGGDNWRFNCGVSCDYIAATFVRVGAFADKIWAVVDQYGSAAFEIHGFRSLEDWPNGGVLLRTLDALPANGRRVYVTSGLALDGYAMFSIRERGLKGGTSSSEAFARSVVPSDWEALVNFANTTTWQPTPVPLQHAGTPLVEITPPVEKSRAPETLTDPPYDGADVGVFGSVAALVTAEGDNLAALGWDVRTFVGDGSVAQAQQVAQTIQNDNISWNTWCTQNPGSCSRTYTTTPALGLVGDPSTGLVSLGTFADPGGFNCQFYSSCVDFGASANLSGSPLEDLPVYLVPATTVSEINNLAASALRHEAGTNPASRAILLVGDRFAGTDYSRGSDALDIVRDRLLGQGIPKRELLSSSQCDTCYAALEQEFVTAVNQGTSMIVGFGHPTALVRWPGEFLGRWGFEWSANLTKPQTAIAFLPGCFTVGEQFLDPHDPCSPTPCETPSQVKRGLFAPATGTTLAFATGHTNGGFGRQHELWLEVLAATWHDAAMGTSWPKIIFDAKNRAETQYPFIASYLRSVGSLGTMVRKHPPVTTAVEDQNEARAPERISLRVLRTGMAESTLELALPQQDHATVALYDARGRLICEIYSSGTPAGVHRITWNRRDRQGERVHSGVYLARLYTRSSGVAVSKIVVVN